MTKAETLKTSRKLFRRALPTGILVAVVTIPAIILGFTKSTNGFFADHKRKK